MKQKLSVFSLLILSFVLLFSCFGFRRIASDTPEAREVYSRAAYDTYAEGNGLIEYEAVEDAVEKFLSERN